MKSKLNITVVFGKLKYDAVILCSMLSVVDEARCV
jgi:hypothetical protein